MQRILTFTIVCLTLAACQQAALPALPMPSRADDHLSAQLEFTDQHDLGIWTLQTVYADKRFLACEASRKPEFVQRGSIVSVGAINIRGFKGAEKEGDELIEIQLRPTVDLLAYNAPDKINISHLKYSVIINFGSGPIRRRSVLTDSGNIQIFLRDAEFDTMLKRDTLSIKLKEGGSSKDFGTRDIANIYPYVLSCKKENQGIQ